MYGWRIFLFYFIVIYDCSNLLKKINMIFIVRGVGDDRGFIYVFKNWVCVKNLVIIVYDVWYKLKFLVLKYNVIECIIYKYV